MDQVTTTKVNFRLEQWKFFGTSVMFRIKLFETDKIISYDKTKEKIISISLEDL